MTYVGIDNMRWDTLLQPTSTAAM